MPEFNQLDELTISFNIFDNGREYSGQDRGYILDNIRNAISNPWCKERIKNREALGYFGHTLRDLAGLDPNEKNVVKVGGDTIVVDGVPSNVCVDMSIDDEGILTHTQQIMDNDEGRKALGMHKSKVGGFSWACSGAKKVASTVIGQIMGFDYVRNPNFNGNRGYVLDSAEAGMSDEQIICELESTGLSKDKAEKALQDIYDSAIAEAEFYQKQVNELIFGQAISDSALLLNLDKVKGELVTANEAVTDSAKRLEEANESLLTLEATIANDRSARQLIIDSATTILGLGSLDENIEGQILEGAPDGFVALQTLMDNAIKKKSEMMGTITDSVLITPEGRPARPVDEVDFHHPDLSFRAR